MKEKDKKLIEEGKRSLRRGLTSILENIDNIRYDKKSIGYDQILGAFKEEYEAQIRRINKLKVDVSDITSRYESIIKEYHLTRQ